MPQLLEVGAIGRAIATGIRSVEAVDCFFPKCRIEFLQRGRLGTAKKNLRVHVADNGVCVVLVDSFQLASCLKNKAGRDFTASDGCYQLLQIGNLTDIRCFINQAPHMHRQTTSIHIIRFLTEQVE